MPSLISVGMRTASADCGLRTGCTSQSSQECGLRVRTADCERMHNLLIPSTNVCAELCRCALARLGFEAQAAQRPECEIAENTDADHLADRSCPALALATAVAWTSCEPVQGSNDRPYSFLIVSETGVRDPSAKHSGQCVRTYTGDWELLLFTLRRSRGAMGRYQGTSGAA